MVGLQNTTWDQPVSDRRFTYPDSNEAGANRAMPLFATGFCYIIPLACGGADALSNMQWLSVSDTEAKDRIARRIVVSSQIDEDCSMETSQRDVLLGTFTWWGFHALLIWMGAWHFFSRDLTDGSLFASDLFAGFLIGATVLSLLRL